MNQHTDRTREYPIENRSQVLWNTNGQTHFQETRPGNKKHRSQLYPTLSNAGTWQRTNSQKQTDHHREVFMSTYCLVVLGNATEINRN